MYKRWFIDDAEEAIMPAFEKSTAVKKITVGVNVNFLPFIAYINGDYVGFDIEMIRTFAQRKNYRVEFITLPFPSLIPALHIRKGGYDQRWDSDNCRTRQAN